MRYTKVVNELYDLSDIPVPNNERELTWLLSFFWSVDQAYDSVADLAAHQNEGSAPDEPTMQKLKGIYGETAGNGLRLPSAASAALESLGILTA